MTLVTSLLDAAEASARRAEQVAGGREGRGAALSAGLAEEARTWAVAAETLVRAAQCAVDTELGERPGVEVQNLITPLLRGTLKRAAKR